MAADTRTLHLAKSLVIRAQTKYEGLWPFVCEDIRRALCLAEAALWCSNQDDQNLPLSRIVPAIDHILTVESI